LPELLHVGVSSKWVFAKSAVKETLPEDNGFISVVVPRLSTANLCLTKALYLRCANRLTNGALLVCVSLRAGVETNGQREFRLKYIGVHHYIGSLAFSLADRDYFIPQCLIFLFTGMKPAMYLLWYSIVGRRVRGKKG